MITRMNFRLRLFCAEFCEVKIIYNESNCSIFSKNLNKQKIILIILYCRSFSVFL